MNYGEFIGTVPDEFKVSLSEPLPLALREHSTGNVIWFTRQFNPIGSLDECPELDTSYLGLARTMVGMGARYASHLPGEVRFTVTQGPANELAAGVDDWHTEEVFGERYFSLIASNRNGTQIKTADGTIRTAPDFSVTMIGYNTPHRAIPEQGREFRTRISIGYFSE